MNGLAPDSGSGITARCTGRGWRWPSIPLQRLIILIKEAWQNSYAGRLIRTIKEEEVDLSEFLDYHDTYHQIRRFLDDVYMRKRIYSSLGYLTPAKLETHSREEHVLALEFELRIA